MKNTTYQKIDESYRLYLKNFNHIDTMQDFMNCFTCFENSDFIKYLCYQKNDIFFEGDGLEYLYSGGHFRCDGVDSYNTDSLEFDIFFLIDQEGADFLKDNTGEAVYKIDEFYFWCPNLDGIYHNDLTPIEYTLQPKNVKCEEWDITNITNIDEVIDLLSDNNIDFIINGIDENIGKNLMANFEIDEPDSKLYYLTYSKDRTILNVDIDYF